MQNIQHNTIFSLPAVQREKESGDAQPCTCIASINAPTRDWPPYHAVQTLVFTMEKIVKPSHVGPAGVILVVLDFVGLLVVEGISRASIRVIGQCGRK